MKKLTIPAPVRSLFERSLAVPLPHQWVSYITDMLVTGKVQPHTYNVPRPWSVGSLHPMYDIYCIVRLVYRYEHPWRTIAMKRRLKSLSEALSIIEQNCNFSTPNKKQQ